MKSITQLRQVEVWITKNNGIHFSLMNKKSLKNYSIMEIKKTFMNYMDYLMKPKKLEVFYFKIFCLYFTLNKLFKCNLNFFL